MFENRPCVAMAAIRMDETRPWLVNYSASTIVGSSGAPILDSRNRIIGVHIEGGDKHYNIGVIPPMFRNNKESPMSQDLTANQPRMRKYEEGAAGSLIYTYEAIGDDLNYHGKERNWAEEIDLMEKRFNPDYETSYIGSYDEELERDEKIRERLEKYENSEKRTYGSSKRSRKEGLWTCSRCAMLQTTRGYTCGACGHALVRNERVSDFKDEANTSEERILEIAKQVAFLLSRDEKGTLETAPDYVKDVKRIFPLLGKFDKPEVKITAEAVDFIERLNQSPYPIQGAQLEKGKWNSELQRNETNAGQVVFKDYKEGEASYDTPHCLATYKIVEPKLQSNKETVLVSDAPKTETRNKRRRRNRQKAVTERIVENTPVLEQPLNLKAPNTQGASTSGVKKVTFANKPGSLATAGLNSSVKQSEKNPKSGLQPLQKSQNLKSMVGLKEAQQPRK
jgi:hypothetical protein